MFVWEVEFCNNHHDKCGNHRYDFMVQTCWGVMPGRCWARPLFHFPVWPLHDLISTHFNRPTAGFKPKNLPAAQALGCLSLSVWGREDLNLNKRHHSSFYSLNAAASIPVELLCQTRVGLTRWDLRQTVCSSNEAWTQRVTITAGCMDYYRSCLHVVAVAAVCCCLKCDM